LANVFNVRFSSLFTCKFYAFEVKLAPFQRHVIQLPAKLDALAGKTSQRREKLIVFSQANGLQFIPKYQKPAGQALLTPSKKKCKQKTTFRLL